MEKTTKNNNKMEKSVLAKKLHQSKKTVKTLSAAPLFLAMALVDWQILALAIGACVVILLSLIYIYLILRKRRAGFQTIVVEKIIRHPDDAKPEPLHDENYGQPSNTYITIIPPEGDGDDDEDYKQEATPSLLTEFIEDEGIDPELAVTNQYGEVTEVLHSVDRETGIALVIRYNKSFTAKLSQTTDETKGYYTALKNELLSYKLLRSRVSWKYDNIRYGVEPIAKFAVRGKTLCLYLALNPDDYADTKYKVERSTDKLYSFVPCLYRIINPRRVRYAAELIADAAAKHNLKRHDTPATDYYLPYEHTGVLIGKRLIKEYLVKERYDDFLRKKKNGYVSSSDDDTSDTSPDDTDISENN
jgi:hypothetical protein